MKFLSRLLYICWITLWYGFAVTTVLAAAVFSLARLLLPMVDDYSVTVEKYFTGLVNQPIKIQSLDAEWHGLEPSLVLKNVRLMDDAGNATIVNLSKARLGFGLFETIKLGQLSFSGVDLIGVDLWIVRHEDGHISLAGFDITSSNEEDMLGQDFLSAWLFGQGQIGLEVRNLIYEDRMVSKRKYHFSDVSLTLKNKDDRHLIEGLVAIPKTPDQKLAVSIDVEGNLLQSDQWSGNMYLSGNQINIINLIGSMTPAAKMFSVGPADFELWTTWENARVNRIKGDFFLSELELKSITENPKSPDVVNAAVKYSHVGARFVWRKNKNGWDLKADNLDLRKNNKNWPETQIRLRSRNSAAESNSLSLKASFLRLEDLSPLLRVLDLERNKTIEIIDKLQVAGDIHDLYYHHDAAVETNFKFYANLNGFKTRAYDSYPGLNGVSGIIEGNEKNGMFRLNSKNAGVDLPKLFRNKLDIDRMTGNIGWQHDADNIYLTGRDLAIKNSDISAAAVFDMEIPKISEAPFLNVIIDFHNGDGAQVSRYLPANIMSPSAANWLDEAIVDGYVPGGSAIFHGKVDNFPFTQGDGIFEVQFDVQSGVLNYAKDWPKMDFIDSKIIFSGKSLKILGGSGRILNSKLEGIEVNVADLAAKPLAITLGGRAVGSTQDKLDYMLISPQLNKKFGYFIKNFNVEGDSNLRLDIDMDIEKGQVNATVNGLLDFEENHITDELFGKAITNATGRLTLLPYGLKAYGIDAMFFGQPTSIEVKTHFDENTNKAGLVDIVSLGKFDSQSLSKKFLPVLEDLVDGESNWKVTIKVPLDEPIEAERSTPNPISFVAETFMDGIEVRLPKPFDKNRHDRLKTKLVGRLLPGEHYLFNWNYGSRLDGIMEYDDLHENSFKGEIKFGGGPVALPQGKGFRLTGHLDDLSIDVWRSLVMQVDEVQKLADPKYGRSADLSHLLHSADLTIDDFQIYGQQARNMYLEMEKHNDEFLVNVNSDELRGKINVPNDLTHQPVELDIDHWELSSSATAGQVIDPRHLPAIKAFAKSVSYKNRKFGSVRLETTKLVEGLRLEQLIVKPRSTTISAHGKWVVLQGQHQSEFALHLDSENLGETMDDLNYIGSITNGVGKIDANIAWPGPLISVDMKNLHGNVNIHFENGKILAMDSSAGRIFGLFSFQTLPRRLLLDFSDIYEKGVIFNVISGNFSIEDGDAYTNDFFMEGPGAKAQAAGRVGLETQDYDQLLTFTPQTADIASIVGLIVATPWGFILPQIFRDNINQAMSVQYTLTGSWGNPLLEPVLQPQADDFFEDEL